MKFIIFGHPRCGSSILSSMVETQLKVMFEPFNKDRTRWFPNEKKYITYVHDIPSLDRQLAEIYYDHAGIKTLCFDLRKEMYVHLLANPDYKIIFMRRRNLLQTLVSFYLSYETDVWHRWTVPAEEIEKRFRGLGSLSIAQLKEGMRVHKQVMDYYEGVVEQRQFGYLKVFYEDLFSEKQDDTLRAVFRFLKVFLDFDKVAEVLRTNQKLNSFETYRQIPNYKKIEAELGNEQTGFLFEE